MRIRCFRKKRTKQAKHYSSRALIIRDTEFAIVVTALKTIISLLELNTNRGDYDLAKFTTDSSAPRASSVKK